MRQTRAQPNSLQRNPQHSNNNNVIAHKMKLFDMEQLKKIILKKQKY